MNTEKGSFVHAIPFFGDLRPEAKKLSKKLDEDKTSSMGTYEALSSLSSLQYIDIAIPFTYFPVERISDSLQ